MIFIGDDWSEDHHDVHLMNEAGQRLASRRLPEGMSGIRGLHELVAAHAEEPDQAVIGIETDRGLWVSALAAAGYQVWVSTHPDGRGAVNMTPGGARPGVVVRELRPRVQFYFWVAYKDSAGKTSKPSTAATATLVDTFGEK